MEQKTIPTLDDRKVEAIAELYASLSDPTRVRIIYALTNGEINVGDLVQVVGLSKSAVSHQLRMLRDRRVIRARKQGRYVYIALNDEHIAELFHQGLDHVSHE
jgi:DNA-binding transcriptional ArsR family regulator